jgi:glyoxylase-like metal-dependent hydrolase (beta-lactamase superfamily II)
MKELLALVALGVFGSACAMSTHETRRSTLGVPRSSDALEAVIDQPGQVTVETVASVDWEVERSDLINFDNPRAKEAKLEKGEEPIQIYFHVLRHPTKGVFLVDTGVERAMRDDPDHAAIQGIFAKGMHADRMKIRIPLGDWLQAHAQDKVQGVFFTHLHLDHVAGTPDLPAETLLYTGLGEAGARGLLNGVVQGTNDRSLAGKGPISEWPYQPDPAGRFAGVVDIFGDGSVWALWVPGHTPGSTAYLVRTPNGPVLLVGDACHTRWGWEHDVEPGTLSRDIPTSAVSLARLRKLVAEHPAIDVRLGHQH